MSHEFLQRPLYRWLMRLLPVGVAVSIGLAALGSWQLVSAITHNRSVSHQLGAQAERQEQTIRLLCDRGVILDGVVEAILAVFPGDSTKYPPSVQVFLSQLRSYHLDLLDQQTNPSSPCVRS